MPGTLPEIMAILEVQLSTQPGSDCYDSKHFKDST